MVNALKGRSSEHMLVCTTCDNCLSDMLISAKDFYENLNEIDFTIEVKCPYCENEAKYDSNDFREVDAAEYMKKMQNEIELVRRVKVIELDDKMLKEMLEHPWVSASPITGIAQY